MSPIRRRPEHPATLDSAAWTALHLPVRQAVRHALVTALVGQLNLSTQRLIFVPACEYMRDTVGRLL
jgi:hypothetical protein